MGDGPGEVQLRARVQSDDGHASATDVEIDLKRGAHARESL